jgi:cytochrome P450
MIAELEPRIRELSRRLLDMVGGETIDLSGGFSVPLPLMVIAEMIGIPPGDWARFRRWSDVMLLLSYTAFDAAASTRASEQYFAVTEEMKAYLPELTVARKAKPEDDLLTRLVEAEVEGERLSDGEILAFVQLLIVAGNETTANLINNAVLCFVENPQALAQIREKPELLPAAIEEVLRYRSPLQFMYRAPRRDVEMHGQVIPAGKIVLAMIGSPQPRPAGVFGARPLRHPAQPQPAPGVWARDSLLPGRGAVAAGSADRPRRPAGTVRAI